MKVLFKVLTALFLLAEIAYSCMSNVSVFIDKIYTSGIYIAKYDSYNVSKSFTVNLVR